MPRSQAITKADFANLRWKRYDSYTFAAQDATVPVLAQELSKACMSLPIAFIQQGDAFITAAVQGLQMGQNLLVTSEGRWAVAYTPAAYRGYPFALAEAEDGQLVLCVDLDSHLVGEQHEEAFFDANGEPAQAVGEVLNFLQQVHSNRILTQRLCAALAAEDLIVPWPLKISTEEGEKNITGLYRIDEPRLNQLDAQAIARIHQAGALSIAYCQLISMQHIQVLGQLAATRAQEQAREAENGQFLGGQDGVFSFNF